MGLGRTTYKTPESPKPQAPNKSLNAARDPPDSSSRDSFEIRGAGRTLSASTQKQFVERVTALGAELLLFGAS